MKKLPLLLMMIATCFASFGDQTTLINTTWNTAAGSNSTSFTSININFQTNKIYHITANESSGNATTLPTESGSLFVGVTGEQISRGLNINTLISYDILYVPISNGSGNVTINSGGGNGVNYPAHSGNLTVIEIDGSVDNLIAEISSLNAQIAALNAQITTLGTTNANLISQLAALQSNFDALQTAYNALQASPATASGGASELASANASLTKAKNQLTQTRMMLGGAAAIALGEGLYLGYEKLFKTPEKFPVNSTTPDRPIRYTPRQGYHE